MTTLLFQTKKTPVAQVTEYGAHFYISRPVLTGKNYLSLRYEVFSIPIKHFMAMKLQRI
jgi:hypothetical protein